MSAILHPRRSPRNHSGSDPHQASQPPYPLRDSEGISRSLDASFKTCHPHRVMPSAPPSSALRASTNATTIPPSAEPRCSKDMSTQQPTMDARRYSDRRTQLPSDAGRRFSDRTTQSPVYPSRHNSDATTTAPGSGGRLYSDFTKQDPGSQVRTYSERSTQRPDSEARGFNDISTQPLVAGEEVPGLQTIRVGNPVRRSSELGTEPPQSGIHPTQMVGQGASGEGFPDSGTVGNTEEDITQASPVDPGFPESCDDEHMSDEDALIFGYNFIADHTDVVLRKVPKVWKRKVSGSKTERVAHAFLYYKICRIERKSPDLVFGSCLSGGMCLFKGIAFWLQLKERNICAWKAVPTDAQLTTSFRPAEKDPWLECRANAERQHQILADGEVVREGGEIGDDPRSAAITAAQVGRGSLCQEFSLSLFGRLAVILRDKERAKQAFLGTRQPLTREQQDNGVRRDDFWDDVAVPFNDRAVRPRVDMMGVAVEELDPASSPSLLVPGAKLEQVWYYMRDSLTQVLKN